ncbi:hypothetical protein CCACVL1_30128 [Corchorus capsularis]|uniref:Uncharacterized protein n=1 Tax=Corchorus capsularis TaxID=210143 RepID=A0A1R3FYL5_COCAP|nr:hypothetical protein CCACVL1_30128 [Corchorus capsularis]
MGFNHPRRSVVHWSVLCLVMALTLSDTRLDSIELIHARLSQLRSSLKAYVIARVARKWKTILPAQTEPINADLLLVDDMICLTSSTYEDSRSPQPSPKTESMMVIINDVRRAMRSQFSATFCKYTRIYSPDLQILTEIKLKEGRLYKYLLQVRHASTQIPPAGKETTSLCRLPFVFDRVKTASQLNEDRGDAEDEEAE